MGKKKKAAKRKSEVLPGTLRIKTADLLVYEKTKQSWKNSFFKLPHTSLVIHLFKANNNFDVLVDKKNSQFLKGQLSPEGIPQGARIKVLPNGKEVDKAFSLFAPHLYIHDERSNHHWNVIYKNKGGTFCYVYTLEKKSKFVTRKYKVVKEFGECYPTLEHNACKALNDRNDPIAVPMYTLLKTLMRVGNETYYKVNQHQGLRTLKKKNISIEKDCVLFDYIGKDGVPTSIKSKFPDIYITRLKDLLQNKDDESFVFVNKDTGSPIKDIDFKDAFKRYCGREFYPHIVRSYYATLEARKFLEECKCPTKEDVQKLFLSIADRS
jgi:DNA topoisomerase IB